MKATYVSIFDDAVVCESGCDYDPDPMIVSNIQLADNSDDAENSGALTDEFVRLPDGAELREDDGVKFSY